MGKLFFTELAECQYNIIIFRDLGWKGIYLNYKSIEIVGDSNECYRSSNILNSHGFFIALGI